MNNLPAQEDVFLKLAAFIDHYTKQAKNNNITLFIPEEFKVWFLQLFEESLGKELKGVTFFPAGGQLTPENLRPDDIFVRLTIGGEKPRQDLWKHLQSKNYPTFELNIKDKKRFSACNSAWPARLSPWPIFGRSVPWTKTPWKVIKRR